MTELHEALLLWVLARLAYAPLRPLFADPSTEPFPPASAPRAARHFS